MSKHVHVHVHGGLSSVMGRTVRRPVNDDAGDRAGGYKRDFSGQFATSSGTGEQHAATAELHTSLALRKGTDHPHHAMHTAAAEAHTQASAFLSQANKAQHPGAAIEAERHAKLARTHENVINKGKGSDPKGEVSRQNKAMSDPRVMKENKERKADFDAKHDKGGKGKKTKDAADCGCGGDSAVDPIDQDTNLPDYTGDVLFSDCSGWTDGVRTQDDWAKWNAEHKDRAMRHKAIVDNKLVGKAQTALHSKAHAAHMMAHHAITNGLHDLATEHANNAAGHEAQLHAKHGYLPKPITHEKSLIDVLNHPEGRKAVESIEDMKSSLRDKPKGSDKDLESMLHHAKKRLHAEHGFKMAD